MDGNTFDFGYGPVPAHRHVTGGGWVADTSTVDTSARVYGNAQVCGNARVCGDAQVYGNARVYGDALVCGNAQVYGNARVYGDALVCGNALVCGDAQVCGNAQVCGDADIFVISGIAEWGTATFLRTSDEPRIVVGCRYFTESEAIAHWTNRENRKATLRLVRFCFEEFRQQCK